MTTEAMLYRQSDLSAPSFNRANGTVDCVISTGAPVARPGYEEVLAIGRDNVNLAPRLPVLDSHRQVSISDIKGRVLNVWFIPGAIMATLKISDPATLDAIERGDVTGVSIGYRVRQQQDSAGPANGKRVRTATLWDLVEVSVVAIPADPSALFRSNNMTIQPAEIQTATPTAPVDVRAALDARIRSIGELADLPPSWAENQITTGAELTAARDAARDALTTRAAPASVQPIVGASNDDPAVIRTRQAEALAETMGGPVASEPAQQYRGLGFTDLARDAVARSGGSVNRMNGETLFRSAMGTSDFPLILEQAGTRVVSNAYALAEAPLKTLTRKRMVSDLRNVTVLKVGEMSALQPVTEAGEIKSVSHGEAAEGYAVKTYAGIFSITRTLLINDQHGVFGESASRLGQAAAAAEADALVGLLIDGAGAGPTMTDGKRLFHADHGNLAAAGAAPDVTTLSAARLALRTQKGVDGKSPVGVTPKYLVVSPALETAGEKLLAELNAATVSEQNPFGGKLTLIVEPRLIGNAWYVFGNPATAPVLELAHLASAPGPQLSSRDGWDVLGREFRVVLDLGVGAIDHRGAYRNAGA